MSTDTSKTKDYPKGWPEGKKSLRDLTCKERDHVCEMNPPIVNGIHNVSLYCDWNWITCGFGQLSVDLIVKEDKIEVMNECMSRDSVRKILHAFADYIADRAVLNDNPEDIPPVDFAAEMRVLREGRENARRFRDQQRAEWLVREEEIDEANRQGSNLA